MAGELTQKVSWPTWSELQGSAIVVMIASIIIASMVFLMDQASNITLTTYYRLF